MKEKWNSLDKKTKTGIVVALVVFASLSIVWG